MPVDMVLEVTDIRSTEKPDQFVLGWKMIDCDTPELITSWLRSNPRTWAYFVHVGETGRVITVQQYLGR